jgi:hypothetical protein
MARCGVIDRLEAVTLHQSQAKIEIRLWKGRHGDRTARVELIADPDTLTGDGMTLCEALTNLEDQLDLEAPAECAHCREDVPDTDTDL